MPRRQDSLLGGHLLGTCDSVRSRDIPTSLTKRYFLHQIVLGLLKNKNSRIGFSYNTFIDNTWLLEILPSIIPLLREIDGHIYIYGVNEGADPSLVDIIDQRADHFIFSSDPESRTKTQLRSAGDLDSIRRRADQIEELLQPFLFFARPKPNTNQIYKSVVKRGIADFRNISISASDERSLRTLDKVQSQIESNNTRSESHVTLRETGCDDAFSDKIKSVLDVAYNEQFLGDNDLALQGSYKPVRFASEGMNSIINEILLLKDQEALNLKRAPQIYFKRFAQHVQTVQLVASSTGNPIIDGIIEYADYYTGLAAYLGEKDNMDSLRRSFRAIISTARHSVTLKLPDAAVDAARNQKDGEMKEREDE